MFLAWGTCGGMEGRAGERRREDYIRGKERKKEGGLSGRRGGKGKKGRRRVRSEEGEREGGGAGSVK